MYLLCCKISGGANTKLFDIRELYNEEYGEYIVGSQEIGTQSLYLVYGEAERGEEREMATAGHEEILFLLSGSATLLDGDKTIQLEPEQAVYMESDEVFTFTALTDCRYVVAGTHVTLHEH
ncbi:MAG: hypothetical protein KAH86_04800 [Methanosarcinales archaeon]|nr:hypothetical protein [Methanosarcinales archaeon]